MRETQEWLNSPQRLQQLEAARAAQLRTIFPNPCPTCGAQVGERCLTLTGKRTAQHATRRS